MPLRNTDTEYDPAERFRLYRLCECGECGGDGKDHSDANIIRCPECRGEGRIRQELAACDSPEAVGVALVTLAREGEWLDEDGNPCQFGLLDREGEKGKRWLILPWPETARTATAAGKLLRSRRSQ